MFEVFKEYFTGDHFHKFTKRMIKTCEICQRYKDHGRRGTGETRPILPKEKGEMVSMDYYGPLLMSTSAVKYILVVVDNFKKYVKSVSYTHLDVYKRQNKGGRQRRNGDGPGGGEGELRKK